MPKKSIFDRYETYDPKVEGYGNADQWRQAFNTVIGHATSVDEARQILGITSTTSHIDIKKKYRSLAFQYHPDKSGNDSNFKNIASAYKIVMDDKVPNSVIITPGNPSRSQSGSSMIMPQLLNEINESEISRYINDPHYCAQEKHDGRRKMIKSKSGKIWVFNKKGKTVGSGEGIEKSAKLINRNYLIDGEEVGDDYYAFDILSLDDKDLRHQIYSDRYRNNFLEKLRGSIHPVYTAYTTQEKQTLYDDLKSRGREGIVFKLLDGVHQEGYSDDQVKFKWYATASVIVIRQNVKQSVGIGIWDNGIQPIGNVTTIGHDKPVVGTVIEVKYLYACRGGSLYQPSFLHVRDDVDQEDCIRSKLKYKST